MVGIRTLNTQEQSYRAEYGKIPLPKVRFGGRVTFTVRIVFSVIGSVTV